MLHDILAAEGFHRGGFLWKRLFLARPFPWCGILPTDSNPSQNFRKCAFLPEPCRLPLEIAARPRRIPQKVAVRQAEMQARLPIGSLRTYLSFFAWLSAVLAEESSSGSLLFDFKRSIWRAISRLNSVYFSGSGSSIGAFLPPARKTPYASSARIGLSFAHPEIGTAIFDRPAGYFLPSPTDSPRALNVSA